MRIKNPKIKRNNDLRAALVGHILRETDTDRLRELSRQYLKTIDTGRIRPEVVSDEKVKLWEEMSMIELEEHQNGRKEP